MSRPGDRPGGYWPPGGQPVQLTVPAVPAVQCARCARVQPPLPRGVRSCVFCSSPLPVQRWRADPPAGAGVVDRPVPRAFRPYFGPPSYGDRPPRWGFPPVVWRAASTAEKNEWASLSPRSPARVAALCLATAVVALVAGGAELWRYLLLLQGRTEVLAGPVVRASDLLVGMAAWVATALAVLTAAVLAPLLVRLHAGAAHRAGRAPGRAPAAVLARLVVPGWNVYGVGVVAGEIDGQLRDGTGRPRLSGLVLALWIAWAVDAVLVLTTLVRAFGTDDQAVADTVELHIFVDLTGAVVAALWFFLLRRWRRRLIGPHPAGREARWVVRAPAPTRPQPEAGRQDSPVGSPS